MPAEEAASRRGLQDYLRTIRRRKLIVVLSLLVVMGASLGLSYMQETLYSTSSKLLLRPRATQSVFANETQAYVDPVRAIQTEIEVINTEPVQELVRAKIGDAPAVRAVPVGLTDLVTITAISSDPRWAATTANAYATSYIEYRRKQAIADLVAGGEEVQAKISDLQKQIDELGAQIDAAPICVDPRTTAAACSQRTNIEQAVGARRTNLLNQQALFRQRLDQLQVDQALANGGATIVSPAPTPTVPFQPVHRRAAVQGVILGTLLGLAVAFLIDHLDNSVKTKEDVERAVPAVNVLALIPEDTEWRWRGQGRLITMSDPGSPVAEAYRILRTSVQFLGLDTEVRMIQVTSPSAEEGKTTTLANLAVACARAGMRTIAVDCDLRRPRLHEFFGLTNEAGFTSVLLGDTPLTQALQSTSGLERLMVLPSGPLPPNPSELLSSARTRELLGSLSAQSDIVLIDSPPTLPVTDALVLSQHVDATILVVSAGKTNGKDAARASEVLAQVRAPLLGAVLNGVKAGTGYGSSSSAYRGQIQDELSRNGSRNGHQASRSKRRSPRSTHAG